MQGCPRREATRSTPLGRWLPKPARSWPVERGLIEYAAAFERIDPLPALATELARSWQLAKLYVDEVVHRAHSSRSAWGAGFRCARPAR